MRNETLRAIALCSIVCFSWAKPAFAQEAAPLKEVPKDPGNWRPEQPRNPQNAPALGGTPLSPAQTPTASKPALRDPEAPSAPTTEKDKASRRRQISKNYDAAEKILRKTLNSTGAEYQTAKTRAGNIKRLLVQYRGRKVRAEQEKRQTQVGLFNRSLYFQKQLKAGKLSKASYERLLKEESQKYEGARRTLEKEIAFLGAEEQRLQKQLSEIDSKLRILEAERPALARKPGKKTSAGTAMVNSLQARLRKLAAFKTKVSLDDQRLNGHP